MSHYRFIKPVIVNDPEFQRSCHAKHGEWWEKVFELIPIEEIRQHPLSKNKLEPLKKAYANGIPLPPVSLRIDKDGVFSVRDGNHRVELSKIHGLTHVPSVFSIKHTETPP